MARIVQQDLWTPVPWPGLYLVTTNSTVSARGLLIMGRGSALQARKRIPGIQREIVDSLRPEYRLDGTEDYGFRIIRQPRRPGRFGFGIFQTKRDWRQTAFLKTISLSLARLHLYAKTNSDVTIRCPLPAAGCGWIGTGTPPDTNTVRAACLQLPDNVTWCTR